jgi:hypothetical protein
MGKESVGHRSRDGLRRRHGHASSVGDGAFSAQHRSGHGAAAEVEEGALLSDGEASELSSYNSDDEMEQDIADRVEIMQGLPDYDWHGDGDDGDTSDSDVDGGAGQWDDSGRRGGASCRPGKPEPWTGSHVVAVSLNCNGLVPKVEHLASLLCNKSYFTSPPDIVALTEVDARAGTLNLRDMLGEAVTRQYDMWWSLRATSHTGKNTSRGSHGASGRWGGHPGP